MNTYQNTYQANLATQEHYTRVVGFDSDEGCNKVLFADVTAAFMQSYLEDQGNKIDTTNFGDTQRRAMEIMRSFDIAEGSDEWFKTCNWCKAYVQYVIAAKIMRLTRQLSELEADGDDY